MARNRPFIGYFVCCAAVLGGLTCTATANAESSIAVTVAPDPVESITTQLGVTGTSAENEDVSLLKVKPAGGRGCAANDEADEGTSVGLSYGHNLQNAGAFSEANNWTFLTAGSYLACAWLQTSSGKPVVKASASLTFTVRQPHLALSLGVPAKVGVEQTFQVTLTVQAETEREVYEYLLPNTGRGCPVNAAAAGGTAQELGIIPYGNAVDGGPKTLSDNEKLSQLGSYLVCAYVEYPSMQSPPEATAVAQVAVVRPTPPCVVPRSAAGLSVPVAEHAIRAAHCRVGRVSYAHSSRRRSGLVISVSPRPGSRLAYRAPVSIVVSSGPASRRRHKRH